MNVPYPLVIVEWVDSFGCQTNWAPLDDVKDERHVCVSVGFLVKDGEHVKVIVPHVSPQNEDIDAEAQGCGDMAIPVQAIIRIDRIRNVS